MIKTLITNSVLETVALGERLGALLTTGDFIALVGELGTGKTQFAKGVAVGLAVDASVPITSPTYTLMNVYTGRLSLYHFDLYRLNGDQDIIDLGFDEYFGGDGVCLVEWAERLVDEMPGERLVITLTNAGDERRRLDFNPRGDRARDIVRKLFTDEK